MPSDAATTTRATASERMRATRERRRRGSVLVEIEVNAAILDRLIATGMLSAEQRVDREAVGAALLRSVRAPAGAIHFAEMLAEALRQRRLNGYG
jgi:Arc/MetJ family transcription regulator